MYVVNPEDVGRLYLCNGLIATYLMYDCKIPLYGRSWDKGFYFAKTKELKDALKKLPFWMRVFASLP
jgi:hypothetical protein